MAITNQEIKHIQSLAKKKFRSQHKLFVAEGTKVVNELIQSDFSITEIFTTSPLNFTAFEGLVTEVSDRELQKISQLSSPNEVLALVKIPELKFDPTTANDSLVIALDKINDPGNLGTIIRIADWFGIKNIVCAKETVDTYNPKTIQAAMGSLARVKVHYVALKEIFENTAKTTAIYACVLDGLSIYEEKLKQKGYILLGSESHGISEELLPFITNPLTIPSHGGAESLNAAMAMAIVCSEFKRGISLQK